MSQTNPDQSIPTGPDAQSHPETQTRTRDRLPFRCRVAQTIRELHRDCNDFERHEFTIGQLRLQLKNDGRWPRHDSRPRPVLDAIIRDVAERNDAFREAPPTVPACPTNEIESPGELTAHQRSKGGAD